MMMLIVADKQLNGLSRSHRSGADAGMQESEIPINARSVDGLKKKPIGKKTKNLLDFDDSRAPASPFFRTTADYFSSNSGLDEPFNPIGEAIAFTNLFSSDIAKSTLNAWRQGLVSVERRLDYAFRSVAQVPVQYLQEGFRQVARSQIAPLFNAELFPKANGAVLTPEDKALYPHLTDKQFKELMDFDHKHCFNVEQLGDLYTALTDPSAGLRYANIPSLLSYFDCEMEIKNPETGKGTGKYETYKFRPNSALATHLKWKLAAEKTLQEQVNYFDLLNPRAQHMPFMPYKNTDEHSVRIMGKIVLEAHNHLKQVGIFSQLPTVYQFLLQAKRGDFTTITDPTRPENTTLNLPLAFKVFSGGLQNEPISEELPMIIGGEGSSLKKLDQLVLKTWLAKLYASCESENPEQLKNGKFGKPADVITVWKALWRDLKLGVDDPDLEAYTQRIGRAIEKILSGKILIKGKDQAETTLIYTFKPDAKGVLGLKHADGANFIKETAAALWQLQTIVKACNQLVNNSGEVQILTPQEFQEKAAQLLEDYYKASFNLATTLPGKNGEDLASLKNLMSSETATNSKNKLQFEENGAYKLLQVLCESRHLRKYRLPLLVKASSIPQLAATVVTGLIATGIVWNYLDNNVIQKYENEAVETKGSVEYTGLVMAAGFVPAMAAFIGMMKMDYFKQLTGNRPHLHFGLVGAIALTLQAILTVGLVRAFIAMKPTMPKPKPTMPSGTFTATAQLAFANVGQVAKPAVVKPSPFVLNQAVKTVPVLSAATLAKQYPYTAEALN